MISNLIKTLMKRELLFTYHNISRIVSCLVFGYCTWSSICKLTFIIQIHSLRIMNRLLLLFVNILILALSSMNFILLNNSFQITIQDDNNVYLAATNGTFTESESRIPSSAEDDEETSIISANETSQEAKSLQNQAPFIEKAIQAKVGENKSSSSSSSSTTTNSTVSQIYNLRNSYLSEWEKIPFQSIFDTFINENSAQGYGIFTERNSSIFNPSQRISLYIEPIGFQHEPTIDTKGYKLYLTNITAIITMGDDQGNEVPSIEDIQSYIYKSHNKITEIYLPIDLDLTSRLLPGNYVITYSLIDDISKEDFDIQKNITIS
jgi:hypothetical protein